jgi:hypothetical protein
MRTSHFLSLAIVSVLVGCSAFVCAQDEKPQDKPTQKEESRPEPKPDETKTSKQDKQEPKQDQKQEQKESRDQMKPQGQERPDQPMDRAQAQGHPEKAGNAGPADKGGHIPDDKFRAQFGRSHTFSARTVIVQGQPQFQYGGYGFQLVDAWPKGWAYTDDCYIDYIDGEYFLFDLLHPGVRVAVFVVM